jgi:hypothetical protein
MPVSLPGLKAVLEILDSAAGYSSSSLFMMTMFYLHQISIVVKAIYQSQTRASGRFFLKMELS